VIHPRSIPPTIPELLDAARLLDCGLLWEPDQYPNGPGEHERPLITAAIAVAAEFYRSNLTTPITMAGMRITHRRSFGNDPEQVLKHAISALSYHANILRDMATEEKTVEDAVRLVITALGLLTSGLAGMPYYRVEFASTASAPDGHAGPCPDCGENH